MFDGHSYNYIKALPLLFCYQNVSPFRFLKLLKLCVHYESILNVFLYPKGPSCCLRYTMFNIIHVYYYYSLRTVSTTNTFSSMFIHLNGLLPLFSGC